MNPLTSAMDPPRPRPHTTAAAATPLWEGIPVLSDSPPWRGLGVGVVNLAYL